MLDMSDAFDDETSAEVVLERDGAVGKYVRGKWEADWPVTQTIVASVQPLSGKEYRDLPEGIRNEAQAKAITTFPLRSGDRIIQDGVKYKVLSLDNWQSQAGYSRAILGALK